jgi:hypothetical protein
MRQPIIVSQQYISKSEFCTIYKVSPHKLQDLIDQGKLGGIEISGILYLDVSKSDVLKAALAYKHVNRNLHSHSNREIYTEPKFQNEFEEKMELDWRKSQEE